MLPFGPWRTLPFTICICVLLLSTVKAFVIVPTNHEHPSFRRRRCENVNINGKISLIIGKCIQATAGDRKEVDASVIEARESSFEDAQVIGARLAEILTASCANGETMPEEATEVLRALVSTTSGARGWFVSLLTNEDFEPVFVSPIDESFLSALCESPGPNAKLMTMNVAMSTATELVHEANGNSDLAAGSRMTSRRSAALIAELIDRMDGLRESIEALYSAVDEEQGGGDKEWIEFCKKWGYGPEQKVAIRKVLEPLVRNK